MHHCARTIVAIFVLACLAACSIKAPDDREHRRTAAPAVVEAPAEATAAVDPNSLCLITNTDIEDARSRCTPGQRVAFLPRRWGNEQLPLALAAGHCDLSKSVVITNGGVVCQYMPLPQERQPAAAVDNQGDGAGEPEAGSASAP